MFVYVFVYRMSVERKIRSREESQEPLHLHPDVFHVRPMTSSARVRARPGTSGQYLICCNWIITLLPSCLYRHKVRGRGVLECLQWSEKLGEDYVKQNLSDSLKCSVKV